MTVRDFLNLGIDKFVNVILFDCTEGVEDEIFIGTADELFDELLDAKFLSWELQERNNESYICINMM